MLLLLLSTFLGLFVAQFLMPRIHGRWSRMLSVAVFVSLLLGLMVVWDQQRLPGVGFSLFTYASGPLLGGLSAFLMGVVVILWLRMRVRRGGGDSQRRPQGVHLTFPRKIFRSDYPWLIAIGSFGALAVLALVLPPFERASVSVGPVNVEWIISRSGEQVPKGFSGSVDGRPEATRYTLAEPSEHLSNVVTENKYVAKSKVYRERTAAQEIKDKEYRDFYAQRVGPLMSCAHHASEQGADRTSIDLCLRPVAEKFRQLTEISRIGDASIQSCEGLPKDDENFYTSVTETLDVAKQCVKSLVRLGGEKKEKGEAAGSAEREGCSLDMPAVTHGLESLQSHRWMRLLAANLMDATGNKPGAYDLLRWSQSCDKEFRYNYTRLATLALEVDHNRASAIEYLQDAFDRGRACIDHVDHWMDAEGAKASPEERASLSSMQQACHASIAGSQSNLAELYAMENRNERLALEWANQALEANPTDPSVRDTHAYVSLLFAARRGDVVTMNQSKKTFSDLRLEMRRPMAKGSVSEREKSRERYEIYGRRIDLADDLLSQMKKE